MHHITYFISRLLVPFLLLFNLSYSISAQADTVNFVRDYTYNASENDSKVSARKAALEQLQRAAIEEVGVQVQASFNDSQLLSQGELKQEVHSNFKTFSQALTKTKIIEEKWNGESFYIKAEIEVDPNGITSAMNALTTGTTDICEINKEKVKKIIHKPANTQRNQALVDIAKTTNFDEDCNRWQYDVLSSLTHYTDYPISEYRTFIFSQLSSVKAYDLPSLMPRAIKYALKHSDEVSKEEWGITLKAMQRMPTKYLPSTFQVLAKFNAQQQPEKVNSIIKLASNEKLGDPAMSKEDTIQAIIKIFANKQAPYSARLYLNYADELTDVNALASTISGIYRKGHDSKNSDFTELAHNVLKHFLDNNDVKQLNNKAKAALYDLIQPLVNAVNHRSPSKPHLKELLVRYPNQFAYLVEAQTISDSSKNLFLLRHKLPAKNACLPEACAKHALNKGLSTSQQNAYLKYLVAYEGQASIVEKDMIKLLDRAQIMTSSVHRTSRKSSLITILANIKSRDTKAINLIIKSLKDFDYKIPDAAIQALTKLGKPAFTQMAIQFPKAKDLSQRRMIEAMGKMEPSKDISDFLKSIPTPKNQAVKFALEDAIEAQGA